MTETADVLLPKRRLEAWALLLDVTRGGESHLREYLREKHATTLPRFDVMAALDRNGAPLSMHALSRMVPVSGSSAVAVVDRLERDGLAQRTPAPDAGRGAAYVALTEAGKRRHDELAADCAREIDTILSSLDASDLDALCSLLERIHAARA